MGGGFPVEMLGSLEGDLPLVNVFEINIFCAQYHVWIQSGNNRRADTSDTMHFSKS